MGLHKKGRKILILGAGAGMAQPFIRLLYKTWEHCTFYLLARNTKVLAELANTGKDNGHTVNLYKYDLEYPVPLHFSGVEFCITYMGWMPASNNEIQKAMLVNFTGIEQFVNRLIVENQSSLQHIIITGSMAGVRVRPANRAYGLAKAALHKYALQLSQKYANQFAVTLVIPGYVRTPMLYGMETPAILTLNPEQLAKKYADWMETQPQRVYSQSAWQAIAIILKMMPQFVINRMKK